jgi:hypothetical protein
VATKVKQGCLVRQDNNIWPLLLDAIFYIEIDKLPALPNPFPDKRIVKLLLDYGADPNRGIPYSNMTPWEYLLWGLHKPSTSTPDLDPWLEIVPQFLACGADPGAITNSRFRSRTKISRAYQVGDALYEFIQSTNNNKWAWVWSLSPRCNFSVTEIEMVKKHATKRMAILGARTCEEVVKGVDTSDWTLVRRQRHKVSGI